MSYVPGQSGNPAGRPKGALGGRAVSLQTLDRMLAQPRTQRALMRALTKECNKNHDTCV